MTSPSAPQLQTTNSTSIQPHPSPRKIGMSARIMVIAFGMVLGLGLLELGFRFFVPVTDVAYQFGDPLLGPRGIPNQTGVNRTGQTMNARYRFNAQGWNHTRDYVIQKPVGTRRICIVGDSQVESIQVVVDKTMYAEAE